MKKVNPFKLYNPCNIVFITLKLLAEKEDDINVCLCKHFKSLAMMLACNYFAVNQQVPLAYISGSAPLKPSCGAFFCQHFLFFTNLIFMAYFTPCWVYMSICKQLHIVAAGIARCEHNCSSDVLRCTVANLSSFPPILNCKIYRAAFNSKKYTVVFGQSTDSIFFLQALS